MNLVIDVGNTRVKVALFKGDSLFLKDLFDKNVLLKKVKNLVNQYKIENAIISSVANISEKELLELEKQVSFIQLNNQTSVPFQNDYASPETLGVDRIALVCAAVSNYQNQNVLIVDAGSCITFDFVNSKNVYLGGAITVGVEMRYKALHIFTDKLPLLSQRQPQNLIGNSTKESIHSGVVKGVISEIDGIISQYMERIENLTVVLTGGDTIFLAKRLKNGIFANPNFLLEGLNSILIYNCKND